MNTTVEKELNTIMAGIIKNLPINSPSKGLLTGDSGVLLLLHYYSKYINSSYTKELDDIETNCIEAIEKGEFREAGYCNGLSGILEVFNHLNEQNLSEISIDEANDFFMSYLWRHIERLMGEEKYDFLYGVIGMIQPFFHFKDGNRYINEVINVIYGSAEKDGNIISFPFRNIFTNEKESNLSISHGLVSVVNFIIKAYNQGINMDVCHVLLNGFINYFLSQKIDREKYNSCYSYIAISNINPIVPSRLAWCYGDLSIALMYWEAGKATSNQLWKNEALDILDFASTRLDLEKNQVKDAFICHGTAGIALIFNKIYRETCFEKYKEIRDYWVSKTMNFSEKDGIKGYSIGKNSQVEMGLLEGLAGIGLMLIACSNEKSCTSWDKLLFIN